MPPKAIDKQRILKAITWLGVMLLFFISVGFTSFQHSERKFKSLQINIDDTAGVNFVTVQQIKNIVAYKFGDIKKSKLNAINTAVLESIIENNPHVANAEVFSTVDGVLNIYVSQRVPVLRIFNHKGESFYIDNEGYFMPLSDSYTPLVPVANGHLTSKLSDHKIRVLTNDQMNQALPVEALFNLVKAIEKDELLKAQLQQIYVNSDGNFTLVPRVGNHIIYFGNGLDMEAKLQNLLVIYTKGFNMCGWEKYKTINLKFKDQVVCGY
ncbi:MAG: hypothetical protein RIQ89_850 [Bacteroidota bacterium]|jgi:cell division protein FtsQ